ncbi:MAG: hypothetical protein ACP5HK_02445 [Acidilobus sp.]
MVYGIGKPKEVDLPQDVATWASNPGILKLLESLLEDPSFRPHVTTKGALRSLLLLLYVRYLSVPPYKMARQLGVSHEQLYRIERALKDTELLSMAISWLDLVRASRPRPSLT